jgi:AcrR family transcriptional regulator
MQEGYGAMAEADPITPLKAARRDKILNAAQKLFTEHGLRATTMEAIAARSAISKATVYAYFRDKDEVFAAVAVRLCEQLRTRVMNGLEQAGGVSDRVTAALNGKHDIVFDVVRSSAFASELFAAQNQIAADRFSLLDIWIQEQIKALIKKSGVNDAEAGALAFLLFSASAGIANHAKTSEESRAAVARLCQSLLTD